MDDFMDGVPAPCGFEVDSIDLPSERTDVPLARRRRAALHVLAIGRCATPEDLVDGFPVAVVEAFSDELELGEALAHLDLLLDVLVPRVEDTREGAR